MKCGHQYHLLRWSKIIVIILGLKSFAGSSPKIFIGVNGGADEFSNFSEFEDGLSAVTGAMVRQGFQTKILNAGGPDGKKMNLISGAFPERDYNGNLILSKNTFGGGVATNKNLNEAIIEAKTQQPASVVLFLTNHRSEKGMATWHGNEFSNSEIKQFESEFPAETLVRRLHLYCFSGRGLAPLQPPQSFKEILIAFPRNRCGFSNADTDEFSTSIYNFNSLVNHHDLSLSEFKSFYMADSRYSATPKLSSDYLKDAIVRVACANMERQHSRSKTCAHHNNKLNTVGVLAKRIACANYKDTQPPSNVSEFTIGYNELLDKKQELIDHFLEQKYPKKFQLELDYFKKTEESAINKQDGKSEIQISDNAKAAHEFLEARRMGIDNKDGKSIGFLNRIVTMAKNGGGNDIVRDPDLDEFLSFLESGKTYSQQNESKKNGQSNPTVPLNVTFHNRPFKGRNFYDKIEEVNSYLRNEQKERKQKTAARDDMRERLVNQIVDDLPENAIRERLNDLKKCEELPLAAGSLN